MTGMAKLGWHGTRVRPGGKFQARWQNQEGHTDNADHYTCPSCKGTGVYSVGDCEDGVWENCEECEGYGEIGGK